MVLDVLYVDRIENVRNACTSYSSFGVAVVEGVFYVADTGPRVLAWTCQPEPDEEAPRGPGPGVGNQQPGDHAVTAVTDVADAADGLVVERLSVEGIVQGVGFRPFVYSLATELGLGGHVGNDSARVFIEVTGPANAIDQFVDRLSSSPPPLARIDRISRAQRQVATESVATFAIVDSLSADGPRTLVAPDSAACADCVRELFDPADRRYRHPFITCTNCGPRFTIITAVPYDRPNTTMGEFALCLACNDEYTDPLDRRYHAQPIACHDCGPTLAFRSVGTTDAEPAVAPTVDKDPIEATADALLDGAIVAVKGVGGYHLVCDATDHSAVEELRHRKHRADKPFAVMVGDVERARSLVDMSDAEAGLLASAAAPIVLLQARTPSSTTSSGPSSSAPSSAKASPQPTVVDPSVAPGSPLLGVMLAYAPVHHLLLEAVDRPLVVTSANRGGEPIAVDEAAIDELADLHDAVLDHDRPIHQPCDDSVIRVVGGRLLPVRRARGYAPIPVAFPSGGPTVLATGGELKNTFCLAGDGRAWVSQHIGDMENLATLQTFERSVDAFADRYQLSPDVVATDAHPGYLTGRWARDNYADRVLAVQHHHAHIAAVMAEHQLDPHHRVIGFAFDGTGYGLDGTIWGGELLVADATGFERSAHLAPIPLPGGDAAVRQPARVALAHLQAAGLAWNTDLAPVEHLGPDALRLLQQQLDRNLHCVPTTSMGRLFDAVASLIGLRHEISYEAQAAIELEVMALSGCETTAATYRFGLSANRPDSAGNADVIDPTPVLAAIVADLAAGVGPESIAWRFHQAVAEIVERLAADRRDQLGLETVALSGGVFQNGLLTELCLDRLTEEGFDVLTHSLVPPNDGGLALGQAFIAANRIQSPPNEED